MRKRDLGILLLAAFALFFSLQQEGYFSFKEAWFHLSDEYPIKFEAERLPPPVVVDLNGDGKSEILVATHDAKIQVLEAHVRRVDEGFTEARVMAEVSLLPDKIRISSGRRPVALAAGFVDRSYKHGEPRKQVVVVVTSGWTVMCFDHNLNKLWENNLQEDFPHGAHHKEIAISISNYTLKHGDAGLIIVGGRMEMLHQSTMDLFEETMIEEKVGDLRRRSTNEKENSGSSTADLRHFAFYAFAGRTGTLRWSRKNENIQVQSSDASQLIPQHNYKLDVHALNTRHPGEFECREFRESILGVMPHRWDRREDTSLELAHFRKHKRKPLKKTPGKVPTHTVYKPVEHNPPGKDASNKRYLSLSPSPAPSQETTAPDPRFLLHSSADATPFPDHSPFLRFPQVRLSTLPSGLRVVTQTSPSATHTASLGVWIDAGSRFEAPGTNGTAHFLEHMIFKGTRRRTARSLEVEIENMGGRLNAYTSREQTTFFADVQSKDVPLAIDVLADILQNSNFPDHAIKRERGVILREMKEVQEQTQEVLFDHLHSAAFHGHPLGDTILGPEENIRRISKVDLRQYISTHYTGPRMVISAAGAVNHDEIVNMVGRLFTNFSSDPTTANQLVAANPAVFTGCEVRVEDNEMPLAHFVVTFKGSSWTEPSSIPLMVIQCLLGSWEKSNGVGSCSGSQLARRVGTDDLAHSFMAFNTNYSDTGLFGVFLSAMPSCLYDLSNVLMEEIRRLAFQVSEDEVTRARNQLKSAMLLHIDGSTAVAENNGRQMLTYGRVMPFIEFFARVDAVDAAAIMETARNFIIDKDVAIAAMGPIKDLPDSTWFRSRTAA